MHLSDLLIYSSNFALAHIGAAPNFTAFNRILKKQQRPRPLGRGRLIWMSGSLCRVHYVQIIFFTSVTVSWY